MLHGLYEETGKLNSVEWIVASQDRTPLLWGTDCKSLQENLMSQPLRTWSGRGPIMHGKTVNFDANIRPENSQGCETRSF